jgi:tripartite-type tricarboxylate transporter receptor subunit TctC
MRAARSWILLLVMALVVAACGGDDDGAAEPEAEQTEDAAQDGGEETEGADNGAEDDAAAADDPWPGPLTIYIPAAPGGGFDIAVRAMQPHISDAIGNDVVAENIEGAGGAIAAEQMLSQPADGTSMLVTSRTIMSVPYTGTPEFDPLTSLKALGVTHEDVAALSVAADAPYDTIEEFVEYARDNTVRIGTSGEGGVWHAAGVILEESLGVDFEFIPYGGGAPAGQAAASGEVEAVTIGAPETLGFIENGDLKMLGVMSAERVDLYPDVPTFEEAGYPDAMYSVWRGFLVHGDTPDEIRDELAARIEQAVTSQESVDAMTQAGFVPTWEGPDALQSYMEEEDVLFQEIFADTGVIVSQPER